jgi:hypothetical protein
MWNTIPLQGNVPAYRWLVQWKEGTNPMSAEQLTDEDRQELEELKGQLGTCNVAPVNTLGFGRRFAEILSRIGNPMEPKRTPADKKNKQV